MNESTSNFASNWAPVTSGVPQGSVLGPLLFLLFINDVSFVIKNCVIKLYADDIKLYPKKGTTFAQIQSDINSVVDFCASHQLSVNMKKCVVFRIGSNNPRAPYYIEDCELSSVDEVKDLGVIIDNNLSFSAHCASVHSKVRRICGLILHSFVTRDASVLMKAFNSYALPHLMYCSTVWSPRLSKDVTLIESCLKSFSYNFIRPPFAPIGYDERLKKFRLISLSNRRLIRDLVMAHKILYNFSPLAREDYFTCLPSDKTRSGSTNKLIMPKCKLDCRFNFFSVRVVSIWNQLPVKIANVSDPDLFKKIIYIYITQ